MLVLVLAVLVLGWAALRILQSRSVRHHSVRACIVMGSGMCVLCCMHARPAGGHTTEMMGLIGALDFSKDPSSCDVVAYMVSIGASKVQIFEQAHALLEIVCGV